MCLYKHYNMTLTETHSLLVLHTNICLTTELMYTEHRQMHLCYGNNLQLVPTNNGSVTMKEERSRAIWPTCSVCMWTAMAASAHIGLEIKARIIRLRCTASAFMWKHLQLSCARTELKPLVIKLKSCPHNPTWNSGWLMKSSEIRNPRCWLKSHWWSTDYVSFKVLLENCIHACDAILTKIIWSQYR